MNDNKYILIGLLDELENLNDDAVMALKRGHLSSFDKYIENIEAIIKQIKQTRSNQGEQKK